MPSASVQRCQYGIRGFWSVCMAGPQCAAKVEPGTEYGCEESCGCDSKASTCPASVPNVMSRIPPAREKFLRKSQNKSRARLLPALQKSPGFQNCFQSNAVIMQ